MAGTQEVEYQVDGKPAKYVIRRVTYGEYQNVMRAASTVELIGGATKSKIDTIKLVDELMKLSVKGDVDFHTLDSQDGLDLQEKVLTFIGMGGEANFRT